MNYMDIGENGRTILLHKNGSPALVSLALRESTSRPGRIKGVLKANLGLPVDMPMPIAQSDVCSGLTAEFRLEMN